MKKTLAPIILAAITLLAACQNFNPNLDNKTGKDELEALEIDHKITKEEQVYQDIIYIPIYSDIYVDQQYQNSLISATLSIRNTSYLDSLFITRIEYFNTEGDKVRSYIDNAISLKPMATVNYVIEKDDDTGGAGANFIVEISSPSKKVKPLIQAVMIGSVGNKGFAFTTNGQSIK